MKWLDDKLWEILASQPWIKNKELKNTQFAIVQVHSVQKLPSFVLTVLNSIQTEPLHQPGRFSLGKKKKKYKSYVLKCDD